MTDSRPAPPIPEDADLRRFPDMPVEVQVLRDSGIAAKGDPADNWYAFMLWCAAFHQRPAGSLPKDDNELAHLAGLKHAKRTWKKHREGALWGWYECSNGRLYHATLTRKVLQCLGKRRAGKAGADARWHPESSQPIEIPQNDACDRNAPEQQAAMPRKERKGKEEESPLPPRGAAQARQARGTRLTDSWEMPPEWRQWALSQGASQGLADREAIKFKNFWIAKPGGVKLDWKRTWENWMIEAMSRAGIRRASEALETADPLLQWRQRVGMWNKDGYWNGFWGPEPGQPGCEAPRELLDVATAGP